MKNNSQKATKSIYITIGIGKVIISDWDRGNESDSIYYSQKICD